VRVYVKAEGWENRALEGEVVRCNEQNDRHFECGMRFVQAGLMVAA
jgi:hypothetical protein